MSRTTKIIAGLGVAALGIAALPLSGAFAATTVNDQIQVNIANGCSVTDGTPGGSTTVSNSWSSTMTLASTKEFSGATDNTGGQGAIVVACNQGSQAFTLSAVGVQTGTANAMISGSNNIPAGAASLNGSVSEWAYKVTGAGSTVTNYTAVPAASTPVATGTGTGSFQQSYKVSVGPSQAPGTYVGKVRYTVAMN